MQPEGRDKNPVGKRTSQQDYFSAARDWYSDVYHFPIAARSVYVLVCLVALATMAVSWMVLFSLYPLNKQRSLVMYTEDVFGDVSRVHSLEESQEGVDHAIVRHILPVYVMAREYYEYDVEKLEESFATIRNQSSGKVFNEYQEYMNPKNPSSPLTRFGKGIRREVTIGKYTVDTESEPYTAQVEFRTRIDDGRRVHKNKYVADITFRFSKIQVDQNTGQVFKRDIRSGEWVGVGGTVDFEVTEYKVREQITVK